MKDIFTKGKWYDVKGHNIYHNVLSLRITTDSSMSTDYTNEVICKKNFTYDNKLIFVQNQTYIAKQECVDNNTTGYFILEDGAIYYFCTKIHNIDYEQFQEYFYTPQELRKLKLKQIYERIYESRRHTN